jgi:hypothetical protein
MPGPDAGQNGLHPHQLLLEHEPLRLWQPLLAQQHRRIGGSALPGRPVALRKAGVGTAGWLAEGDQRRRAVGRGRPLQAECGRGIEEAVGKRPGMERASEACEQGAQPGPVGDHRRQGTERLGGRIESPGDPWTGGARRRAAGLAVIEIIEDVVDLAERALRLDLGAEARFAGAGIALEGGDRGVLVLDHPGDRAEGPVGDVPGDSAAELAGGNPPGRAVGSRRDDRRVLGAEQRVQMVAIGIELADDLGRDVRLSAGLEGQDGPESVAAAGGKTFGRLRSTAD